MRKSSNHIRQEFDPVTAPVPSTTRRRPKRMERILHIPFGIGARFDRRTIPERLRLRAVVEGSVAVDGHHDGRSRPLIGSRLELAGSQMGLKIRRGV